MGRRSRRRRRGHPAAPQPGPRQGVYARTLAAAARLGLGPADTVTVGISGGPDSSALLLALSRAASPAGLGAGLGFRVHAAHLVHDFRGQEKYDDAEFVRQLCAGLGLGLTVEERDVAAYQRERGISSFEQAARDLRYAFLERVARSVGARYVAVAHTADDQAETVLLHIARGSGLHGLRGMAEVGPWPGPAPTNAPRLWRPLLTARREDTIAYCRETGVAYRDDSTNLMEDFARNRVRLNLMPALAEQLNPAIIAALGRLSQTAAVQLDYLEQQADVRWPEIAPEPVAADGALRLRRDALAGVHPALQSLLLRRAWVAVTGDAKRLTEKHLRWLMALAADPESGKSASLPAGYAARTQRQWLELAPAARDDCPYPTLTKEFRLTLPGGPIAVAVTRLDGWEVTARIARAGEDAKAPDAGHPLSERIAAAALAEGAIVRTGQPGDRIQPLGMAGRRKLTDVFASAGIPRGWRTRIPLVVTPRGIAWAVGVRIAEWAAWRPGDGESAAVVALDFRVTEPP